MEHLMQVVDEGQLRLADEDQRELEAAGVLRRSV